jgi:D-alanine-D-alanine ligase
MQPKSIIGSTEKPHIQNDKNSVHVALVYGGMSSEREVSLMSFAGLKDALLQLGYKVTPIDMGNDIASALEKVKPDVVFNSIYGTYGEDGCLAGLLEIMGIKYTHSGVLASSIGFNKEISKKIFTDLGIVTPQYRIVAKDEGLQTDPLPRPYVIKPISEGSSIGVIVVLEDSNFDFSNYEWKYGNRILVEEYIPGHEITVGVLGNKAIGAIEIETLKRNFSDYDSKYTDGMEKFLIPAPLPKEIYEHFLRLAELAHTSIKCRSISRSDFRYNPKLGKDGCYILEINTQPGLTPISLIPNLASHYGITYTQIVDRLVQDALHT